MPIGAEHTSHYARWLRGDISTNDYEVWCRTNDHCRQIHSTGPIMPREQTATERMFEAEPIATRCDCNGCRAAREHEERISRHSQVIPPSAIMIALGGGATVGSVTRRLLEDPGLEVVRFANGSTCTRGQFLERSHGLLRSTQISITGNFMPEGAREVPCPPPSERLYRVTAGEFICTVGDELRLNPRLTGIQFESGRIMSRAEFYSLYPVTDQHEYALDRDGSYEPMGELAREHSPTRPPLQQPYADTSPEVWLCIAKPDAATAKMIFRGDPKCKVIRCQDGTEVLRRQVMKKRRKKLVFDVESAPVPQGEQPLPGATPEFVEALRAKMSCYVEPERFKPELDVLYAWFEVDSDPSVLTPSLTIVALKLRTLPGGDYTSRHCNAYARLNEARLRIDDWRSPEDCADFMEAYFRDELDTPALRRAGYYGSWVEPTPVYYDEFSNECRIDEPAPTPTQAPATPPSSLASWETRGSSGGIYEQLQQCDPPPTGAPLNLSETMDSIYRMNRERQMERAIQSLERERLALDNAQTNASPRTDG